MLTDVSDFAIAYHIRLTPINAIGLPIFIALGELVYF